MKNLYMIVGRICDGENSARVVEAVSLEMAQETFEQEERAIHENYSSDFYFDVAENLETMVDDRLIIGETCY